MHEEIASFRLPTGTTCFIGLHLPHNESTVARRRTLGLTASFPSLYASHAWHGHFGLAIILLSKRLCRSPPLNSSISTRATASSSPRAAAPPPSCTLDRKSVVQGNSVS